MLLERLRVIQKAALKIVSTLAPVKESKQIVLEFADLAIAEPKYSSIDFFFGFDESQTSELDIPFLTPPELTKSLCFDPFELWNTEPFPFKATVVDLTEWINAQLESPLIVFFSVDLVKPLGAGKSYDKDLEDGVQNQEPKNGKTKSSDETRNFSSRATRKQKEKSASLADVFDLIYPILQPPLGEAFDNLLILAEPLKPWQVEGVRFLLEHEQALLADDMGLGKTIQAIVALRLLFHQGRVVSTLIVCPKSILRNWNKELWKWSPLPRQLKSVFTRCLKAKKLFFRLLLMI